MWPAVPRRRILRADRALVSARVAAPARAACNDCMDCFEVCPEPQVIRPALKGEANNVGPVILAPACTNCGRCIDVCSKDVFSFGLRYRNSVSVGADGEFAGCSVRKVMIRFLSLSGGRTRREKHAETFDGPCGRLLCRVLHFAADAAKSMRGLDVAAPDPVAAEKEYVGKRPGTQEPIARTFTTQPPVIRTRSRTSTRSTSKVISVWIATARPITRRNMRPRSATAIS